MEFHRLPIRNVRRTTRDAIVVEFDVPTALDDSFRFTAGQYVTLRSVIDGREERRSYSICCRPGDGLRVGIKRVDDGTFSRWAHEALAAGRSVDVAPPQGRFCIPLDPAHAKHYLAFAAGSGITPILSLIETTLAVEPESSFTLVYGNRSASSTMFREELQHLKDRFLERLALLFVTSRERQEVDAFNGRIDRQRARELFDGWIRLDDVDVVFLCGPEAMMDAVRGALEERGFDPGKVIVERFATDARPARERRAQVRESADDLAQVSVKLDGAVRRFEVRRGVESVLEAGLRAGIDLPYSCKGGVCSTCRAQLEKGEVDMDVHFALEDYEVRSGVVLMCQSHPVTDQVELDVDAIAAQLI